MRKQRLHFFLHNMAFCARKVLCGRFTMIILFFPAKYFANDKRSAPRPQNGFSRNGTVFYSMIVHVLSVNPVMLLYISVVANTFND